MKIFTIVYIAALVGSWTNPTNAGNKHTEMTVSCIVIRSEHVVSYVTRQKDTVSYEEINY